MPTAKFANGIVITTYPVPPADFDFERASDEERMLYGIPRFTGGSRELQKRWQETVQTLQIVEPIFKERETRRKALPDMEPGHGTETYDNWSGCVIFPVLDDKIWCVNGTWNIPKASLPSGAQTNIWYTASTWIGIDGDDGSGDIIQAGCDADVMISDGEVQYQFNPWWEWFPAGSFWITNIPASAGDEFTCFIQCIPLLAGTPIPDSALLFLANVTQSIGLFFVATAPAGVSLKGNCAKWILEALETGPGGQPELAKYTTVEFTECSAITVRDKTVLPDSGNMINMVDSSGNVISRGEFLGSTVVKVSYD